MADWNIGRQMIKAMLVRAHKTILHENTSNYVKSMKLSGNDLWVKRNEIFNRDTWYGHVGDDVSNFLTEIYFSSN